jgi:hypothetical protein
MLRCRTPRDQVGFERVNTSVCEQWHSSVDLLSRHVASMAQLRFIFTLQVSVFVYELFSKCVCILFFWTAEYIQLERT